MNNTYGSLIELFKRLIDEADGNLLPLLKSYEVNNVMISAPSTIIELFKEALAHEYNLGFTPGFEGKYFVFKGITIYPSCDWAITLYHRDYVLYKHSWMIRKIPLGAPSKEQKEWYTKYIIDLKDFVQ